MRITFGAAALLLAAGVNAQIGSINKDGNNWRVPEGLDLYPCISNCGDHWSCQYHPFANLIHACGGGDNWSRCTGFCVPNA
ncbi:hypothetical protein BGZ88_006160 [Linnemannia elongata]|uniref:Uncharacterized protein n=1 Tax=Linnemannia elongata AG-77 TaxID=1314771 RepID=A0A197JYH9_9FUNG|nr:hypothetical protein BGZ88_006160 [Linnemannia elongata]OAQ30280.1 hypothetical protein K457DRAFT_137372 [Linnemannia elongata AG-77]